VEDTFSELKCEGDSYHEEDDCCTSVDVPTVQRPYVYNEELSGNNIVLKNVLSNVLYVTNVLTKIVI